MIAGLFRGRSGRCAGRCVATAVVALAGAVVAGCGSRGEIEGLEANLAFVADSSAEIIVEQPGPLLEVRNLKGECVRTIGRFTITDIDDAGRYGVGYTPDGAAYRVEAGGTPDSFSLGGAWPHTMAISPDGTAVVATDSAARRIRFLSVATGAAIGSMQCPADANCQPLWDATDPGVLWFSTAADAKPLRFDVRTREGQVFDEAPSGATRHGMRSGLWGPMECPSRGLMLERRDESLLIQGPDTAPRTLVKVTGVRYSLAGERVVPIGSARFVGDCAYVLFSFWGRPHVVEVKTGRVAEYPYPARFVLPEAPRPASRVTSAEVLALATAEPS